MDRILLENIVEQHRSSKPKFITRKTDQISTYELFVKNARDIPTIRPGQQRM